MLDVVTLMQAKVALSKSKKLRRIWSLATHYNGLRAVYEKGPGVHAILEEIMENIVLYLVYKPPTAHPHNQPRIEALAKVMLDIAQESQDLGVKLLHVPKKLVGTKDSRDWSDYLEYWLERACKRKWMAGELAQAFEAWCDKPPGTKFFDYMTGTKTPESEPYLSDAARENYRIYRDCTEWKLVYDDTRLHTQGWYTETPEGFVMHSIIFVANVEGQIFCHHQDRTSMNHSCFLAGGPVLAAGLLGFNNGKLRFIRPDSGHYKPTPQQMVNLVRVAWELDMDAIVKPFHAKDLYFYVKDLRNHGPHILIEESYQTKYKLPAEDVRQVADRLSFNTPPSFFRNL